MRLLGCDRVFVRWNVARFEESFFNGSLPDYVFLLRVVCFLKGVRKSFLSDGELKFFFDRVGFCLENGVFEGFDFFLLKIYDLVDFGVGEGVSEGVGIPALDVVDGFVGFLVDDLESDSGG